MIGHTFGNLVVEELSSNKRRTINQESRWYCRCNVCGDRVRLHESLLISGVAISCGGQCGNPRLQRNMAPFGTHCGPDKSEYASWKRMWLRVYNKEDKDYGYYGFKGMSIHPSWVDFTVFLSDMGKKPVTFDTSGNLETYSLDRIGANGGNINYEPQNCRWATAKQQNSNKGNNREMILFNGVMTPHVEVAKILGVHRTTLANRIDKHGVDKALTM